MCTSPHVPPCERPLLLLCRCEAINGAAVVTWVCVTTATIPHIRAPCPPLPSVREAGTKPLRQEPFPANRPLSCLREAGTSGRKRADWRSAHENRTRAKGVLLLLVLQEIDLVYLRRIARLHSVSATRKAIRLVLTSEVKDRLTAHCSVALAGVAQLASKPHL